MEIPRDPRAIVPRRDYIGLLALSALIGVPVSVAAWAFLQLVHRAQHEIWEAWPRGLGYDAPPWWWIVAALVIAGLLTGLAVERLKGHGGHVPIDGTSTEQVDPRALPGILLAAFAALALGVVLGPEAPLIALGSGLGVLGVRLVGRDPAARYAAVAGSFAALSTVFGSPLVAAFMLMEIIGLGGSALSTVLLPGLLAAGVGSLVFTGLGAWSGLPPVELEPIAIAPFQSAGVADVLWAIAIGAAAALLIYAIKTIGRTAEALVAIRPLVAIPLAGVAVAACAIVYRAITGHHVDDVLFSGQTSMGPLIASADSWTTGALALVILLKGLAYGISLGSFRGGPIFPAMYLGAAGGLLVANLPGLDQTPAVAAAVGGMTAAVFGAPLSSVLLVAFFLASAGPQVLAIVIVAVVAAHVTTTWLPHPKALFLPRTEPDYVRPVQMPAATVPATANEERDG